MKRIVPLFLLLSAWAVVGLAQQSAPLPGDEPVEGAGIVVEGEQPLPDPEEEDGGFLVEFIQGLLSAPGREVQIRGVSGVLSSEASISSIVVSDAEGPWLRIQDVGINWSRRALFLRRVQITELTIGEIEYLRPPLPPEAEAPTLADAEATPFTLPELPLAVRVESLEVGRVVLGEEVAGQAAVLAAEGYLTLEGGELDTELAIQRLDEPGGELTVDASFSNETRVLDLEVALNEPEGGIVATALGIEGEPAIELSLAGGGPLEDLDVDFSLDAGGERLATGTVALEETAAGLSFLADFSGELAPLVPAEYRDFFAGQSEVRVAGTNLADGGIEVEELLVSADALELTGGLATGADGFLQRLNLSGTVGSEAAEPVTLPVPGGETVLGSGSVEVNFGEGERWSGELALDGLRTGDLTIGNVMLSMGGLAQNLQDPASRNVTIEVEGAATGLRSDDTDVQAALGERVAFVADVALPPEAPIEVRELQVTGEGLLLATQGRIEDLVYTGRSAVEVEELAVFAGLAGRELAGAVNVEAVGDILLASGGFDLVLDGMALGLEVGDPRIDPLLVGETELSGGISRDEEGLRTDNFRIANPQVEFVSSGRVSGENTDIGFEARLDDLGLVLDEASGPVTATGRAVGSGGPVEVSLRAAMPEGALLGRAIVGLTAAFEGAVDKGNVTGALSGGGQLGGNEIDLEGEIALVDDTRRVDGFRLAVGSNEVTGDLVQVGDAPIEGSLELRAPDVAPLAALALMEAGGAANAVVQLAPAEVGQGVSLTADIRDLVVEGAEVAALELQADIQNAFGVPLADATLTGEGIAAGGVVLTRLDARARQTGSTTMDFEAETRLAIGTEAVLEGSLERYEDGLAVTLSELALEQEGVSAELEAPATISLRGEEITLTPLALDLGEGRIEAEGSVGEEVALDLLIDNVALSLANLIQPELDLAGTVNGSARVGGTAEAPQVAFDLTAAEVTAAPLRDAQLPPVTLEATGETDGSTLNVSSTLAAPGGLQAQVSGDVPLNEDGTLDLDIDLGTLPLPLVDALAGGLGLQGTLTGTAAVTGSLTAPEATFSVSGTGLSAEVLRENAIPALSTSVTGSFAENTVSLTSAAVTGPSGLGVQASGVVPLEGPGLDVSVSGEMPLSLANAALAERTAQLAGEAAFDLSVTGSIAEPQISGPLTVSGGTFVDPGTNVRLENIALDAAVDGQTLVIDSLTARSAGGGVLAVSGALGLDPAEGLPADLEIELQDLVYTDGAFVSTTLDGSLSLTGPIGNGGGALTGVIDLGVTEISVAEALGTSAALDLEQVVHRNTPAGVAATLERARVEEGVAEEEVGADTGLVLDVLVRAPNRIFIRGRGLDVELGGQLQVEGPISDIQPVGQFDLIRGRLNILGQRIEFEEGYLQLVGNLNPVVYFVARTETEEAVITVTVSGRVSEPEITFSSQPELPQDEVLALLLFDRTAQQLSPFQLAQLAAAAAELAGGGGNGLLSQFRGAFGLDDLDIVTDETGGAAVRAGRYIDDNIYLDVETGTGGNTRASVNLDITDDVTARGTIGTDGNSSVGIFYERDY